MCLPLQPFKIEREWEHAGLQCAVAQAFEAGHRCGYVRVPPGHPLHGKDYDTPEVGVHGGLTFAEGEPCEHGDGRGWWFGFDCSHAWDERHDPDAKLELVSDGTRRVLEIDASFRARYPSSLGHYWTQREVEAETQRLASQLAGFAAIPLITVDLTPDQEREYQRLVAENG